MMYLQVLGGFVLLIGGAEVLVRGAVDLAHRFGISPLVVGMTIVAFGTSAPELVVTLDATLSGAPGLAIGNLVGSNIANVLLILGAACVIKPILDKPQATKRDAYILIGGTVIFVVLAMQGELGRIAGAILLVAFFGFISNTYWRDTHDAEVAEELIHEVEELQGEQKPLPVSLVMIAAGLAGLTFGADVLVEGGVEIARTFGVSEEVIGLTLFALGTSLPELAASGVAAYRGHPDVAIGNVVGSNLFNILGVGGVVALVAVLPVAEQIMLFDVWIMLVSTAILLPVLIGGWRLTRAVGFVLLAAYVFYVWAQTYGVEKLIAQFG